MPILYGASADWWTDTEDQNVKDLQKPKPNTLIDPFDPDTYKEEHFRTSKARDLILRNYYQRLQEILKNA